jgi:TonB family protein
LAHATCFFAVRIIQEKRASGVKLQTRTMTGAVRMKTTTVSVAILPALLVAGPALAEPSYSQFGRNNVNEVTEAEMTLPAPVQAFQLFCVAKGPAQPYRLAILVDPKNASYREIDRSDRADPSNPQSWEGRMGSIGVRMYFPTIDGITTLSYGIANVHINNGLRRLEPNTWFYWRNNIPYDCVSSERDGELTPDLINKLKTAAAADLPANKDGATSASPAYLQAVKNLLMSQLGAAAGRGSPKNGKAEFLIGGDGKLIRASIVESSGDPVLDQTMTRAIHSIKAWPPPGDHQAKSISIGYGGY